MQPLVLEYKLSKKGSRICSFPECKKRTDLIEYSYHQLCSVHYDFIISRDAGHEPPICTVPMCNKISHLVEYEGRLLCQTHYRKMNRAGTCYIDICPQVATDEFKGKLFCRHHCEKIKEMTTAPQQNPEECNYIGCHDYWTVSGFNNRWCPEHYLEMCRIRESINHDNSPADLAARLKEIKIRKDGFSETGLRHRWYYLQTMLCHLSK